MNICIVAREVLSVPPQGYGGSERVIYDLTEELVKLGHNVYLFAKHDSKTSAILVPYPGDIKENEISDFVERNIENKNIDIIHDNTEFLIYNKHYNGKFKDIPILFTLHYASKLNYEYPTTVYPSYFMRNKIHGIKELTNVVYHGINVDDYKIEYNKSDYLLYMGILKDSKGVYEAIEVANKLDMKLLIYGPQDSDDPDRYYFNNYVKPYLNDKIIYRGVVTGEERLDVLTNAKALLFPTKIETFGLVAVEAMASGTPVLMLDTCTGRELLPEECVCIDTNHMIEVIKKDLLPNSSMLRNYVSRCLNRRIMAENYTRLYENLINNGRFDSMKTKKPTISLCMICKNEEKVIGNCLESVKGIVDEIIIVDTGSTDRTKEIVSQYTDKVYDFEWIYSFSAARNFALRHATGDYILWLDSDDVFTKENQEKLLELKKTMDGSIDLYWMYYDYRHDSKGNSVYSFQNERIFKNHRGVKWDCVIHEVLELEGKLSTQLKTDIRVTHTSNHDNTSKYLDFFKINEDRGHVFNSREMYFYTMELYKHGMDDKCLELFEKILANPDKVNSYEMSSIYSMKGTIEMRKYMYREAIISFANSSAFHQPLPYIQYSIAECYRATLQFDHAIFYYRTIVDELLFRESFANDSVYTDFDRDLREFKIKSLLSLVMIYYYNLNDVNMSENYNNVLLSLDPNNESALTNKAFFDSLKEGVK